MAVRLERFIDYENGLQSWFERRWTAAIEAMWPEVERALEAGDEKRAIDKIMMIAPASKTAGETAQLRTLLLSMLNFGSALIEEKQNTYWSRQRDNEPLGWAEAQVSAFERVTIKTLLERFVSAQLSRIDRENIDALAAAYQVSLHKAAGKDSGSLKTAAKNGARAGSAISANLTTSRLVNYGALHRMRARRVTQYALRVTLDQRTSTICRGLVGKTFQVDDGLTVLKQALTTEDPNDLRTIHPWIPNTKEVVDQLASMPAPTMQSKGWLVPPFHARCRTVVEEAGSDISVEVEQVGGGKGKSGRITIDKDKVVETIAPASAMSPETANALAAILSTVRDVTKPVEGVIEDVVARVRSALATMTLGRRARRNRRRYRSSPVDKP